MNLKERTQTVPPRVFVTVGDNTAKASLKRFVRL